MSKSSTLIACLCVAALVAALGSCPALATLTFTGSPIITYDEPFYMYSYGQSSWCVVNKTLGTNTINCAQGLPMSSATQFAISSPTGGCGPVPVTGVAMGALYVYDDPTIGNAWCRELPTAFDSWYSWHCEFCATPGPYMFNLTNVSPVSDGYLHGNASTVNIRDERGVFCSALPLYSNYGQVRCNASVASTWESFYLVVVA